MTISDYDWLQLTSSDCVLDCKLLLVRLGLRNPCSCFKSKSFFHGAIQFFFFSIFYNETGISLKQTLLAVLKQVTMSHSTWVNAGLMLMITTLLRWNFIYVLLVQEIFGETVKMKYLCQSTTVEYCVTYSRLNNRYFLIACGSKIK